MTCLVDRIHNIENEIKKRIATKLGTDVKNVILGKRARIADFKPPLIWVLPEDAIIDASFLANTEQWELTYWLIAVVKSTTDSYAASQEAESLAIRSSAALLADRRLGGLVEDTVRQGWSSGDSRVMDTDESLYGAAVRVKLKTTVLEVE